MLLVSSIKHFQIKKNPDKVITADDVFLRTHKKNQGAGEFVDAKSKKFFEDYTTRKNDTVFDSTAWVDASGCVVKNRLYGFGSLVPTSDIVSSSTGSSYACLNNDFTQTQQLEDKVYERVEQMRNDIRAELKNDIREELKNEVVAEMEKMKADFQLQLQQALRSFTGFQQPPPSSM